VLHVGASVSWKTLGGRGAPTQGTALAKRERLRGYERAEGRDGRCGLNAGNSGGGLLVGGQ